MRLYRLVLALVLVGATTALAHQGVTNAGVMARMENMSAAKKDIAILNDMAKSKTPFDQAKADAAKERLLTETKAVAGLFSEPHTDPKSEALPKIWDEFDLFIAQADRAVDAMANVDTRTLDTLRESLKAANAACVQCHKTYRLD
ncbi:MAG: cytochrome c [Pseudomonadota bacterium]